MKQTKEDQAIALLYENVGKQEATPEQQAKFREYMAKHKALRAKYDHEFEIEMNGEVYTVYANVTTERQAVDHRASIGHYGVSGKDVYGNVPTGIEDMEAYWYDPETDFETEVTDPNVLKALAGEVQSRLDDMDPEDVGFHERDDDRDYDEY